jgi:hypothetical protein
MGFRKSFQAPPVPLRPYYKSQQRRAYFSFAAKALAAAIAVGLVVGIVLTPDGRQHLAAAPAALGMPRARAPEPGDHWAGCNDARAAGTAPIYAGEPGYRDGMDGDGDGIACEPYRGW